MKTLKQNILERVPKNNQDTALMTSVNNAQYFIIDNVSKMFYESNQIFWDLEKDFPNIAPPFDEMFFEYKQPSVLVCEQGTIIRENTDQSSIGVLVSSKKVENKPYRWIYAVTIFMGKSENVFHRDIYAYCGATEDGIFYSLNELGGMTYEVEDFVKKQFYNSDDLVSGLNTVIYPVFLAISFMHCKNVIRVPRGTGTNNGRRNRHTPGIKFYTLQIEPMRRVLETEGESKKNGLKNALHICRGHFKDYRETGLFGKYHDIYWWDSMVRGSEKQGIVLKDYKVNSPKRGASMEQKGGE